MDTFGKYNLRVGSTNQAGSCSRWKDLRLYVASDGGILEGCFVDEGHDQTQVLN